MKMIYFRKKEYVLMEKDELDSLLFELAWRLSACNNAAQMTVVTDNIEVQKANFNYIKSMIEECCELANEFENGL